MKYANGTHALWALLRLSNGEEETKTGRITKFSTIIHISRQGLNYYFVEITGSNRCYFTNSEDALRHYEEIYPHLYDLVILDIRMPKLNGIQLFYRLKAMTPNVRIMFLTALDAAEELISIHHGVKYDDIIKKPVCNDELVVRVAEKLKLPTGGFV